jgi:hypothetical protein
MSDFAVHAYLITLGLHGLWRWAVLAAGLSLVSIALAALARPMPAALDRLKRGARLFVLAADIQLVLGLTLFLGLSPVTRGAMRSAMTGEAGYFVFHLLAMVVAIALAHAAGVVIRRQVHPRAAALRALALAGASLLLLLMATPWWRPLARLGGTG